MKPSVVPLFQFFRSRSCLSWPIAWPRNCPLIFSSSRGSLNSLAISAIFEPSEVPARSWPPPMLARNDAPLSRFFSSRDWAIIATVWATEPSRIALMASEVLVISERFFCVQSSALAMEPPNWLNATPAITAAPARPALPPTAITSCGMLLTIDLNPYCTSSTVWPTMSRL